MASSNLISLKKRNEVCYCQWSSPQGNDQWICFPKNQDIGVGNFWLQQDDTRCDTANDTIALLSETFDENKKRFC